MMIRPVSWLTLVVGATLATVLLVDARADDAKSPDGTKGAKVESKSEKTTPAAAVDFNDVLGLSFKSLVSLGTRIDEARRGADPVGLAQVATELAVAEKVSGKTASITAEALFKEADELARRRYTSTELHAVSLLLKDETRAKALATMASAAKTKEEKAAEAFKKGEVSRAHITTLIVHNHTNHTIHIRFEGANVGSVAPHTYHSFSAPPAFYLVEPATVELLGWAGSRHWGPVFVAGNHSVYRWTLNP